MPDDEQVILEEALENLRETAQSIRAVSHLMRSTGMGDDNYHDLAHRVASALAMTEAAAIEVRKLEKNGELR